MGEAKENAVRRHRKMTGDESTFFVIKKGELSIEELINWKKNQSNYLSR